MGARSLGRWQLPATDPDTEMALDAPKHSKQTTQSVLIWFRFKLWSLWYCRLLVGFQFGLVLFQSVVSNRLPIPIRFTYSKTGFLFEVEHCNTRKRHRAQISLL